MALAVPLITVYSRVRVPPGSLGDIIMNQKTFEIEYNEAKKTERKVVKNKKTGQKESKTVQLKEPKCWQIVTTTGDTSYCPGTWLNESQMKMLSRGKNTLVHVGLPGQYRVNNSRGY
tara:strand:+ start:2416 stop:2766 length:351 start_codon:yes stop_codon:yes gene_type:complete